MTNNLTLPPLGPGVPDRVSSGLRALVGAVPIIGSALAEIVTEIVPSQRIERIEAYLGMLAEELSRITSEQGKCASTDLLADKMREPANIDLIEDGARIASRALSADRIRYISTCVANGLTDEERTKLHHKKVLAIIEDLDDEELLILDAYASNDHGKFDRIRPPPATLSASNSVVERNALYDASLSKLERLSLLSFKQKYKEVTLPQTGGKRVEKLRVADVDSFGRPSGYRVITALGRYVLGCIGLIDLDASEDEELHDADDDY